MVKEMPRATVRRDAPPPVPMVTADAREAWTHLLTLFFGQRDRFLALSTEYGLTPAHTKALLDLDPDRPAPMRQLASQLSCDASWVTSLVDRLEERGFVARRPSSADRRVKEVVLTEAGRAARERIHASLYRPPDVLLRLRAPDQKALLDIVRRMTAAIDRSC